MYRVLVVVVVVWCLLVVGRLRVGRWLFAVVSYVLCVVVCCVLIVVCCVLFVMCCLLLLVLDCGVLCGVVACCALPFVCGCLFLFCCLVCDRVCFVAVACKVLVVVCLR